MALIPADAAGSGVAKAEMALLTIPVTSGKNWSNYVQLLSAQFKRPPWAIVTEVYIERDPKTQFKVLFNAVAPVPEEVLGDIRARVQPAQDILLQQYEYSEEQRNPQPETKQTKPRKY